MGVGTLRLANCAVPHADFVQLCMLCLCLHETKTCRGAVVLLDNKLQDVPKDNKPQAASLAHLGTATAILPDLSLARSCLLELIPVTARKVLSPGEEASVTS